MEGTNGDRLEFVYVNVSRVGNTGYVDDVLWLQGVRQGAATYTFADGSTEISTFNELGEQTGPAKFTWANGAVREGNKVRTWLRILNLTNT